MMDQRLDYRKAAPHGVAAFGTSKPMLIVADWSTPCWSWSRHERRRSTAAAFCLDMHTKDARGAGESEQRLYVLSAWREAPFYSERERAALAWTEAITRISDAAISDTLYEEVRRHLDEKELVDLTLAVIAINGWNRLAIPFRTPVGSYQPRAHFGVSA